MDIIDKYYVSTIPLAFGVPNEDENSENNWDVSCITIGMRIMRYDSNNDDFLHFIKMDNMQHQLMNDHCLH